MRLCSPPYREAAARRRTPLAASLGIGIEADGHGQLVLLEHGQSQGQKEPRRTQSARQGFKLAQESHFRFRRTGRRAPA